MKLIKNNKKSFLIVLFSSFSIFGYFYFFYPKVEIVVYNKTGFDIDSLNIEGEFYKIAKNKSLVIKNKKISIQDNLPSEIPRGIIKNMKISNFPILLCGEGISEIRKGKFKFDLKILTEKNEYFLYWKKHK
jgi:hypothetical protein